MPSASIVGITGTSPAVGMTNNTPATANATIQPMLLARVVRPDQGGRPTHGLLERAQAELASTTDGGLWIDGIVAASHRRVLQGAHERRGASVLQPDSS
jgi:hypothetical protein